MKYAYVIMGVVQGVVDLPSLAALHEDSRPLYITCGDEVVPGWTYTGGVFSSPISASITLSLRDILGQLEGMDKVLPRYEEDMMDMLQAKGLVALSEWPEITLARKAMKDGLRLKVREVM